MQFPVLTEQMLPTELSGWHVPNSHLAILTRLRIVATHPSSTGPQNAHGEAVFLERYGQPAAVLVSPDRVAELMESLEDADDITAFDEAMAEEVDNIPWDQVSLILAGCESLSD
jgi:antitoxin Phd